MLAPRGVPRRTALAALTAAGVGTACRATSVARPELSLGAAAERYVRLTLEAAQHQPSLVEQWLGPAHWRPGVRRPVSVLHAEIADAARALERTDTRGEERQRARYLQDQLDALMVAARRLGGESMPFTEEARAAFGDDVGAWVRGRLPEGPGADEPSMQAPLAVLQSRLPGRGPLHERYAAFRARHALPAARVLPAFAAACDICRRDVLRHLTLAESERVDTAAGSDLGVEARAVYQGDFHTRVLVDASGGLDLARLVWLAAHETYPGHHLQHVLADRDLIRGRGWLERALHPAFGRHLLCAEGAAEAGAALLLDGVRFEELCREVAHAAGIDVGNAADLVAVQRAVAELDVLVVPVARAYLDGDLGSDAAATQLAERALVIGAQQFLFTIERQRTRLLAYPAGRRLMAAHVFALPPARRWEALGELATRLSLPA